MRVITCNVNGIRSAARKSFFDWLKKQDADVVCLQEIKAHPEQLLDDPTFSPPHYHVYWNAAEKKGYSGVAIYTRYKPDSVISDLGLSFADREGRFLQIDLGNLSIASLYFPSGTSGPERQAYKIKFMEYFEACLREYRKTGRQYILCGDWNIAHTTIDLENWKSNQKSSGFLPEERAWLDTVFDRIGFVDAFRVVNKKEGQYTWWSMRSKTAWDKNVGWRIDYQIVSPDLRLKVKDASIYRGEKFSDHAPVIVDYAISHQDWKL
jgi:exodeoxyribonuclease-3